jgi:hypothetical protein
LKERFKEMGRFYQHLEFGEQLGKITRLKYIDDISDDELILFYFIDGTKCSTQFIMDWDSEEDPQQTKKVMAEITSPANPWIIERHEIVPDEDRIMVGADGVRYQAPDPSAKSVTNGTSGEITEEAKSGIRIELKHPRRVAKYDREPDEMYLLSLHPELETAEVAPVMTQPKKAVRLQRPVSQKPVEIDESFDLDAAVESAVQPKASAINRCMDFDRLGDTVVFVMNGKQNSMSKEEFVKRLSVSSQQYENAVKNNKSANLMSIMDNEDVLIKNMIDKSKKNKCKITMSLSLDIPPQEVYDTIKMVYEEGMADQFVKSLTARYLSQDNMLSAISSGLSAYYEKKSA